MATDKGKRKPGKREWIEPMRATMGQVADAMFRKSEPIREPEPTRR